jgi:hypothetical protein
MDNLITIETNHIIPIEAEILLYKYNYIDSKLISKLKREVKIFQRDTDSFVVNTNDLLNLIIKHFKKHVVETKKSTYENIAKNANSAFFIYNLLTTYTNLKEITINVSYKRQYSRMYTINNQKMIGLDFKFKKGLLDLPLYFKPEEVSLFNYIFKNTGLIDKQEEFFSIHAQDLSDSMLALEEVDPDLFNNHSQTFDLFFSFIDKKLEDDNPIILVKTDFFDI